MKSADLYTANASTEAFLRLLMCTNTTEITLGSPISAMAFSHWITLSVCRKWRPVAWNKNRQEQERGRAVRTGVSQLPSAAGRFIKTERKNSALPENEVKSLQYTIILTAYDQFFHKRATNSAVNLGVHPPSINVLERGWSFQGSTNIH